MTFLPSVRLTKKAPKYLYLSLQYTDSHMSWHIQRWSKAPRSGWRFLGAFSFSWALQGCWCGGNVAMVGLHVCINSHRCPEFPSHAIIMMLDALWLSDHYKTALNAWTSSVSSCVVFTSIGSDVRSVRISLCWWFIHPSNLKSVTFIESRINSVWHNINLASPKLRFSTFFFLGFLILSF